MEQPIAPKQIVKIKVMQKQRDISDEDYRKVLAQRFGVASCTKLTMRQARQLIDFLQGKTCFACGPRPKREPIPDNVTLLASPDQLHMIEDLRQAHSWAWNPVRYNAWLKKRMGIDKIITSIQASIVIEALKAMIKQEKRCACRFNQREE